MKKLPHKQKPTIRDIRKDLRVIYESRDGNVQDMSKLNAQKKSGFRGFLIKSIVFLFLLSAIAWTGFFVFSKGFFQKQDALSVEIEGPTDVRAGAPVTYLVHYENTGNVPLASLDLSASFPPGFHLTSSIPPVNDKNIWKIGALTPKSDGTVTLHGMFLSEVPSSERIQILFTYKPANFNSTFQQIETKKVDMKDSILTLQVKGPEKSVPGDETQYVLTVGHAEKNPAFNLRMIPKLPPNFTITSQDPPFETGHVYWNIATIDPNQPKSFSLKGTFTSSAAGVQQISGTIGFMQDDVFLKQKESNVQTEIKGGSVGFHLIVNGSNKDQSIDAGKVIHGSINFANQGTEPVGEISFALQMDGGGKSIPIDWSKADLRGGKQQANELQWNKETTPALLELPSTDKGVIDFSLPLLQTNDDSTADRITLKLVTTIGKFADGSSARTIESNPIVLSIQSTVGFHAEARYFDEEGQPVGTGPLPPKVGQATSYRIYVDVTNSIHDLVNIKITSTLPKHVTWKDKKSADIGSVDYNPTTRIVTWSIPKLPKSIPKANAWFDITNTPKSTDVGKFITLTSGTSFTAKETKTNVDLTNSVSELTTELPNDPLAEGKGTVKK
ncbi:MAG: hypothetical protein AAB664_01830 [Patescibacteria group bacterium]